MTKKRETESLAETGGDDSKHNITERVHNSNINDPSQGTWLFGQTG